MTRIQLPCKEILVQDRQRPLDHAHVKSLADSIKDLGLVQPIVINQDKRLIAGGHRLAAHLLLGKELIDVVYRETLTEDELQELELTENLKRKDNSWQETCLAVAKIHFLKVKRSALESKSWGQRDTGNLLNVNQANVMYSLAIAKELICDPTKSNDFWKASNFSEAYGLLMKRSEDEALARLANVQTSSVFDSPDEDIFVVPEEEIDLTVERKILRYEPEIPPEQLRVPCPVCNGTPNGHCEHCMDTGWAWDTTKVTRGSQITVSPIYEVFEQVKVPLSQRYVKGDSIAYMHSHPESFDHVITDIPFGIDIDYIDQSNSIKNISDIRVEHTVEGNLELHAQFFKAAFTTLKPEGFCITWLDIMQWDRMYNLAVDAGFKVTRWPFVWIKTYPCLNQMAQYNFTKSTEYAMICRKGNITLPEKQPTCHIATGKDELCEGHPFAKPFACWERLISAVSIKNNSILDPFAGSGSCLKSGIRLERQMFGIEKDEALYNAGLESMKQFYLGLNPRATFV